MQILIPKLTLPKYPCFNSPYYDIREWVDARTWNAFGIRSVWQLDPRQVRIGDLIRKKTGAPTTINNWHFVRPGETVYDSSGFRAVWDQTGGKLSQHRRGFAGDYKVRGIPPLQVCQIILANLDEFLDAGLTTIENIEFTPSWLHLDCREKIKGIHPDYGLLVVDP